MCGIIGIYNLERGADRSKMMAQAEAMQQVIAHRGPDAFDIWQDAECSLVLGQRRLAIIDLSEDGKQPMASPSGRYMVTYNGEIYNYLELKKELEVLGQEFRTKTDTEVMLAAIEHWGFKAALNKLNGMFAIALWDHKEKKLSLARDRFGKKPLYVGWAGNNFLFSSELKAFHQHDDFNAELDQNSLAIYMQYSYVHAPYSIFKNVWQLMPGSYAVLDFDQIKPQDDLRAYFKEYWNLPSIVSNQEKLNIDEDDALERFEEHLERSVRDRMFTSDVPLGAFLSGGIDSSCVVALMQKLSDVPVKTFSIGFDEADYNEADKAKEIAAYLGTEHREFYVSAQDALDVIPKLPDIYDEPFADSSQIPTHLISKLARDHVTVALTGDGGDEALGGYERHTHVGALWNKVGWMPHPLRQVMSGTLKSVPQDVYNKIKPSTARLGQKIHRSATLMGLKDADAVYQKLLSAWSNGNDVVLNGQIPTLALHDKNNWPQDLSFTEEMMLSDCLSYRSDDLMVKADRASMAVGLELRAPLMDYELTEFCWQLPQNMKVKGLKGKCLLRQVLDKHIPKVLTDRPKQHFGLPLDDWLRGSLKEWGGDLLAKDRLKRQGLFDADLVSKAWQDYQNGEKNSVSAKALWTALMFQTWSERWMK